MDKKVDNMKAIIKKIKNKKIWSELDSEIIGIKAIGDYNEFVTDSFSKTIFVNKNTSEIYNYKVYYNSLLDKGGCIFFKGYLIFREGFEKEYLNYIESYIGKLNEEDTKLLLLLNTNSSLGMIKTYLKLFNQGILSKEKVINILEKYFYKREYLLTLLT